jgi:exonuclease SbcD
MTRIAITADVHADDYSWARVDPETGMNARFNDMVGTARWVAAEARARDAEVLVMCGDYTESKVPARAPRAAKIARAFDAGPDVQVHLRGNHDAEWAGDSIVSLLERTRLWSGFTVPGIRELADVAICAIPYLDRKYARVLPGMEGLTDAALYARLREEYLDIARGHFALAMKRGPRQAILVGHQQLAGSDMTDSQRSFLGDLDLVVDARALSEIGFAAVVMGHVHRAQEVVAAGGAASGPVLYAGSQERVDFAEEHEAKSFVILELGPSGLTSVERIDIPARRFVTLRSGAFDPEAVAGAVVRAVDLEPSIDRALLRHDLEAAGAFAVTGVEVARPQRHATPAARAIADAGSPDQQLVAALAGDPDADRLLARGREFMTEEAT